MESTVADVLLEIRDLSLDRGDRRVLAGFDLSLRRGEIFGLLGPNGAGKSSAFGALVGFHPVVSGEIRLDGEPVPPGANELRRRMGVVFQSPALDPRLDARTNLSLAAGLHGLPASERRSRVAEMLRFAELEDRAGDPVRELSGGMRRRLEIARGFLHGPSLLLMDEPTTGLDEASFQRTWETLRRLAGEHGVTILLTTHRAEEAELCDRLAFLSGGKIVAQGTPEELRDRVGGDVLELEIADPEAARETLERELDVAGEVRPGRLRIVADRGHELVPKVVQALPRDTVRSLSLHRPGLSDVFLELTGRDLSEDEE